VEEINIKEYMKQNKISYIKWNLEQYIKHNFSCPYNIKSKCVIYPVRPIACRLFGVIPSLPCNFGKSDNILSKRTEDNIMRELHRLNVSLLHENPIFLKEKEVF